MREHENPCQALFSRGIAFAKSLIITYRMRFPKSAFGKIAMCGNKFARVLLQLGGYMQIAHLENKHGGRITAIHAVGHSTYKGVADWFYRGDIEWIDGGKSVDTEIPPWTICFDHDKPEAHAEYAIVDGKLNAYLLTQGEWRDRKFTKDGRVVCWTPKQKEFSLAL